MISVIDRYILRELNKTLFSILLILILVMASLGFVKLLEKAALGDMNLDVVMPLMGLKVISYLARSIPPALFLSVLVVLGRMYRDAEVTALYACGVSNVRIYRSFFYSLIPLAGLTAWLALSVQPWAQAESQQILSDQREIAAELAGLHPGRFIEHSQGELVFYFETFDREQSEMHDIFIQNRQHGKLGLITAESGRHSFDPESGDHYLSLYGGRRYEGTPGRGDYAVAEFVSYTMRIAESGAALRGLDVAAKPTDILLSSDDVRERAELRERLSYPLSLFTLMLVAVPLSRSMPRQGMYGRLFFAFLVYFSFLNLHTTSVSWMERQVTPEWLGVWWVQGVMMLMAAALWLLDSQWLRRLRRRFRGRRVEMSKQGA